MQYDINLLRAFQTLFIERSVSRAAEKLHISQSAMSAQLAKLRALFNDPLFTREKYGIAPTETALKIANEVSQALSTLDAVVLNQQVFDPATATNTFVLAANDYFEALVLPSLLKTLREIAPHVRLKVVEFTQSLQESQVLTSDIHLAFGRISHLSDNIVCQSVCMENVCCLVGAASWEQQQTLSMTEYETREHIVVKPTDKLKTGVFSMLSEAGIERKVKCEVTHFHYLPELLLGSDYIATVPIRIARHLSAIYPLTQLSLPHSFPDFPFHLAWHQRYQKDISHQWFRETVKASITRALSL